MKTFRTTRKFFLKLAWVLFIWHDTKSGNGERENEKWEQNRIGNDITDRSRVQVRFCSHFSFLPIPFHVLVPRFPFPVLITSVNLFFIIVDICGFSDQSLWRFRQCGLIYFLAVSFSIPLCELPNWSYCNS